MRRIGNLWDKITDIENIKLAHRQARKGKSFYSEVMMVDADLDKYAKQIQDLLLSREFDTSEYETEERFDGRKIRTIHKLPYYPDRIVQHALLNVVGPIFTRSFIRDTFQSISGRGTSDAMKRVKTLVRSNNCPAYAIKIDVKKYYPSVNNELLKIEVRRKIKCQNTLWLIDNIIDSIEGLPIGNYTSQHLGNLYLSRLDWMVKQEYKPQGYFRYCDDIVFMDSNKAKLLLIKAKIIEQLVKLKLEIKKNWNLYTVAKDGIDFVGFVFRPKFTRLRKTIATNFKANCKRLRNNIKLLDKKTALSSLMAYKGWVKSANAKKLWRNHVSLKLIRTYPKQLRGAI
jgi:retron-type reverse transcriptase